MYDDNIPNQIIPMILVRLKDHLTTTMKFELPDVDPAQAKEVKVGRFIKDPVGNKITVAIAGGDFEDPGYVDGRIDNPKFDGLQIKNLAVSEIGGGYYWWRRGTIRLAIFLIRQRMDEESAMKLSYDVYGRLLDTIEGVSFDNMSPDDYGEHAYNPLYLEGATFFESGGNTQWIWRGKILWRVLTWRP